jgi:hypothetical protein
MYSCATIFSQGYVWLHIGTQLVPLCGKEGGNLLVDGPNIRASKSLGHANVRWHYLSLAQHVGVWSLAAYRIFCSHAGSFMQQHGSHLHVPRACCIMQGGLAFLRSHHVTALSTAGAAGIIVQRLAACGRGHEWHVAGAA